jgi:hypothetical protein
LDSLICQNELKLSLELTTNIKEKSEKLLTVSRQYFPENLTSEFCIRDPFSIEDILTESLIINENDELIELSSVGSLQQIFKKMDLTDYWLARRKKYPFIPFKAVKFLLVLSISCLCQCGFSSMIYIKNKYRNRLSAEHGLRLKLTKTELG